MPLPRTAYRWALTALYLYGALFVLLSIDLLVRIWELRAGFPRFADVAAIFFFEVSRSTVTAGALGLGLWLLWRRAGDPAARALATAIGFAALAFTQAAAFRTYPGRVQAQLAAWLLEQGTPREVLTFLFGSPLWAAWFALAALLLFATRFPAPASAAAVLRSGARDRAGMMAGVGLAGLDVGTVFRRLTAALLERGVLRTVPLALGAATLAAVHHPLQAHPAAQLGAALLGSAAVGVVITLLRAGQAEADSIARERLDALRTGAVAAAVLLLAAGAVGLLPGRIEFLSAALVALAPAPALYGVARAALTPGPDAA